MTNRTVSIKQVTWNYLSVMLLLFLLAMVGLGVASWRAYQQGMASHHRFQYQMLTHHLTDLTQFYQNIAEQMSKSQQVEDILRLDDVEGASRWAREMRRLIPESVGIALIDSEGQLLGEPQQLKLGPQCLHDMELRLRGIRVPSPPVHSEVKGLEHFDIIQDVVRDGERIGLLFISFSLDVVKKHTRNIVTPGQHLLIEDEHGNVIAESGDRAVATGSNSETLHEPIPGTDWHARFSSVERDDSDIIAGTFALVVLAFVGSVVLVIFLSLRLVDLFKRELLSIKDALSGVCSGLGMESARLGGTLLETREMMDDVNGLMEEIEKANLLLREQSVHDELSGLLNRRGFWWRLAQFRDLSERSVASTLAMLDLDDFKSVNDRYGHTIGDKVIVALADALRERCRTTDVLARIGGDEFAVILTSTDPAYLKEWFQEVTDLFLANQQLIEVEERPGPQVTLSCGAVAIEKTRYSTGLDGIIKAADAALYRAKELGRARLSHADEVENEENR